MKYKIYNIQYTIFNKKYKIYIISNERKVHTVVDHILRLRRYRLGEVPCAWNRLFIVYYYLLLLLFVIIIICWDDVHGTNFHFIMMIMNVPSHPIEPRQFKN